MVPLSHAEAKSDKAEKVLQGIKNPEKSLIKTQLAYYYLLMGMIESQRKVGKAETLLKRHSTQA